ncbi:MAG: hypothetical protein Q8N81_07000, partial [bacterium]|nr:hypothetical protein [bacterium]
LAIRFFILCFEFGIYVIVICFVLRDSNFGFLPRIRNMMRFKEIVSGIRSCFLLTANERLIFMLVLALFLFGLALRWRHLNRERADRYEPGQEMNELRK